MLTAACGGEDGEMGDEAAESSAASETGDPTTGITSGETTGSTDPDETGPEVVSYSQDIVPIFATRCTLCHHANSAIGINIADAFAPMTGLVGSKNTWAEAHPEGNTPEFNVAPGDPANSFLLDKISNPDLDPGVAGSFMPWEIPRLTDQELQDLRTWITDGAANDEVFTTTIAPIFGDATKLGPAGGKCTYCHYAGGQLPNLTDPFDPMTGAVGVPSILDPDMLRIAPGAPDESFLVLKVEATEAGAYGAPMPMHFRPLVDEEIETISTWIEQGAQNN
jgi:hypothetical protein